MHWASNAAWTNIVGPTCFETLLVFLLLAAACSTLLRFVLVCGNLINIAEGFTRHMLRNLCLVFQVFAAFLTVPHAPTGL
jgi:hypothetical protein